MSVTPEPSSDEYSAGERPPRSVAVIGSCLTRDVFNSRFNPGYKRHFRVDLDAHQQSIISLMSAPIDIEFAPTPDLDPRAVHGIPFELSRGFRSALPSVRPDYLILDFAMDATHGVVRLADGRYFTRNPWWIQRTDWFEREEAAGRLEHVPPLNDPDAYFELWRESFDRFADLVERECPDTTVIVHRGGNVELVQNPVGHADGPFVSLNRIPGRGRRDIATSNRLWERFNDHAVTTRRWASIDVGFEHYPSVPDHPWGMHFTHYRLDYHPRFLAELHAIDLARRLSVADQGQMREVLGAVHTWSAGEADLREWLDVMGAENRRLTGERDALQQRLADARERNQTLRQRLAVVRNRNRRLRSRLDAMASQGPFRAAGSALKRRLRARRKQA